jgi:hypothetical protein
MVWAKCELVINARIADYILRKNWLNK